MSGFGSTPLHLVASRGGAIVSGEEEEEEEQDEVEEQEQNGQNNDNDDDDDSEEEIEIANGSEETPADTTSSLRMSPLTSVVVPQPRLSSSARFDGGGGSRADDDDTNDDDASNSTTNSNNQKKSNARGLIDPEIIDSPSALSAAAAAIAALGGSMSPRTPFTEPNTPLESQSPSGSPMIPAAAGGSGGGSSSQSQSPLQSQASFILPRLPAPAIAASTAHQQQQRPISAQEKRLRTASAACVSHMQRQSQLYLQCTERTFVNAAQLQTRNLQAAQDISTTIALSNSMIRDMLRRLAMTTAGTDSMGRFRKAIRLERHEDDLDDEMAAPHGLIGGGERDSAVDGVLMTR